MKKLVRAVAKEGRYNLTELGGMNYQDCNGMYHSDRERDDAKAALARFAGDVLARCGLACPPDAVDILVFWGYGWDQDDFTQLTATWRLPGGNTSVVEEIPRHATHVDEFADLFEKALPRLKTAAATALMRKGGV